MVSAGTVKTAESFVEDGNDLVTSLRMGRRRNAGNLLAEHNLRMRNLIIVTLALVIGVSASLAAADQLPAAFFGTWKLNTEQSKANSGAEAKGQTVTIERRGQGFAMTIDVDNGDGTTSRTTRTAALDGKDVNVQGIANPAVKEAYTRVDDRTFQRVVKLNGQVRNTLKLTVAPDGKSVTAVTTGTGADGKAFNATSLLNKQ